MSELIIGVIAGVIASTITFSMLFIFRPRIKVSPKICRYEISKGKYVYLLKIYNKSYLHKLIDLDLKLVLVTAETAPKGKNLVLEDINLKKDSKFMLDRRRIFKDIYNRHALIISITDDIDKKWTDPTKQTMEFQVKAKNSFTNLTRIVNEPYNDYDTVIENGKYSTGSCCDIMPVSRK